MVDIINKSPTKLFSLSIMFLALTVLLSVKTVASEQQPDDYEIQLKSRQFVPQAGVDQSLLRQLQAADSDARLHVLVQFWQIPSTAEKAALDKSGIQLLNYIPTNAWLASIPAGLNLDSKSMDPVRWIGAIRPEDRTSPILKEGLANQRAVNDDGTVSLDVRFFADVSTAEATAVLAKYNALIDEKIPDFHRFSVRVDPQALVELAAEDTVQWLTGTAPPKTVHNDGIRAATNVNTLQTTPYSLTGSGVNLGEWDGGKVDTHLDFSGRLTVVDAAAPLSDHATHVAGTMAGDGANSAGQGGSARQWRGMATGASIYSYYWDNNLTDHNGAINTYGIELSQNSWGYTISSTFGNCSLYGNYDLDAPDYDDIVTGLYGTPISVIFSAGNERNDGDCGMSSTPPYLNYANVGPPSTAKNMIAVGAANSNDDSMTTFSSWGPLDDGRLSPTIVAPGCQSNGDFAIKSTMPGNTYGLACGTSMAAPAVSGIAALLIEQHRTTFGTTPLPSTLKAILVQTAVDLDDVTSYYNPGPDFASGYGRVDAHAAADLIIAEKVHEDQVSSAATDTFYFDVAAGTPSIQITLAWDDEPGAPNASPALVNNLDLILTEPNGVTTHLPWVLNPASPSSSATTGTDSLNNVEQVTAVSPAAGSWKVEILGTTVPVGPQRYSLAGENFTLTPATVQFESSDFSVAEAAGTATITATLNAVTAYDVTVDYETQIGTATPGDDYTIVTDTLTFPAGDLLQTFSVPILDDALGEDDETVLLLLTNPTVAALGDPAEAVLTILDDDLAVYLPLILRE